MYDEKNRCCRMNVAIGAVLAPLAAAMRAFFPLWAPLSPAQTMQALQIIRQTHQTPLARHLRQSAQRKLPEAQYLFDDPKDRLHGTFAPPINQAPPLRAQFMTHARAGRRRRAGDGGRLRLELLLPIPPMARAPG